MRWSKQGPTACSLVLLSLPADNRVAWLLCKRTVHQSLTQDSSVQGHTIQYKQQPEKSSISAISHRRAAALLVGFGFGCGWWSVTSYPSDFDSFGTLHHPRPTLWAFSFTPCAGVTVGTLRRPTQPSNLIPFAKHQSPWLRHRLADFRGVVEQEPHPQLLALAPLQVASSTTTTSHPLALPPLLREDHLRRRLPAILAMAPSPQHTALAQQPVP